MGGFYFKYDNMTCEKEMVTQKDRVIKIRKTVDSLTNEVIVHLNTINRLLTEIEHTLLDHAEI